MSASALIAASLVLATPLLFAGLGELLAERAGVINLGLEGTMLIGAAAAFGAAFVTGSAAAGLMAAFMAAALFGAVFGVLVIVLKLDQIVTGLAFTMLGGGLSAFFGKPFIGLAASAAVPRLEVPVLGDLPVLGPALFRHDLLVYLALALTLGAAWFVSRTRAGLILRGLGDDPAVVDAAGLPVASLRFAYVVAGAGLAGLGGAYLSLVFTPSWIENMTAGRGWIALALVIFATWRPLWLLGGALLFGMIDALRFRLQMAGDPWLDPHFLNMLPYLATLAVLAMVSHKALRHRVGVPAALGTAYQRESR